MKYLHTMKELLELQSLPLEMKLDLSKRRIREFYEHMEGRVYVSFSGGKDSTVLLHLVRSLYPDVKAVYCCTGIDYPEVAAFAKATPNVEVIYPKKHFLRIMNEDGLVYPSKDIAQIIKDARRGVPYAAHALRGENRDGTPNKFRNRYKKWESLVNSDVKISDVCCDYLKEFPAKEYNKRTGLAPFVGLLAQESFRRTLSWLTAGCNRLGKRDQNSKPLSLWTEQDVLQYILNNRLAIPSVYGEIRRNSNGHLYTTGLARTGCMFCAVPLAHGQKLTAIKERYPKLYDTFVNKNGLGEALAKLGVDYE